MFKVAYYPKTSDVNSYSRNLINILKRSCEIQEISLSHFGRTLLRLLGSKHTDLIVLNWIENAILVDGKVHCRKLIKVTLKVLLLRVFFKRMVYVRHNFMPHDSRGAKRLILAFMNLVELLSNRVFVHSEAHVAPSRSYLPHPLYSFNSQENEKTESIPFTHYFVIFGRLKAYKGLDEFFKKLPKNINVVIVGSGDFDIQFHIVNESEKSNIHWIRNYVPDVELARILKKSLGTLIVSSSQTMILSGSVIFSLSAHTRIIALQSNTNLWLAEIFGTNVIRNYLSIEEMCEDLHKYSLYTFSEIEVKKIRDHFSEDKILKSFLRVM